jgi:hypothetical protein
VQAATSRDLPSIAGMQHSKCSSSSGVAARSAHR